MKFIDLHCDTISKILVSKRSNTYEGLQSNSYHVDLCKMKSSGYLAQNFAMFIYNKDLDNPFEEVIEMIDTFYGELDKYKASIALARNYDDIIKNEQEGKMSAFLTLEEGAMIKGSLANLRTLYRLGARMMTLTWNFQNELGSPNLKQRPDGTIDTTTPDLKNGITECGLECLSEMERLGMIIDVSHLSDAGFYDIYHHTTKPFVASHSNSRAICNHTRNLPDDCIRKLSERGGVMGINFEPSFLSTAVDNDFTGGTIEEVIRHIKHIKQIGGIDCIGLGSDFDGIAGNRELKDATCMPTLCDHLENAGFSNDEIEKICYRNALRVYREVLK